MRFSLRIVFFALLVLFLISAFLGVLISYNTSLTWSRFTAIAVGVALCVFFAVMPEGRSQSVASVLPVIVVVYFLLTNDWTSRLGKVAWLDPLLQWFASWQPQLPGLRLDSNSLGGVIAVLLPLQVAALSPRGNARTWGDTALIGISAIGLLLSESRGAWLALAVVGGIGGLWQVSNRIASERRSVQTAIFASILALVVIAGVLMLNSSLGQNLVQGRSDRWNVWRNSFDLANDYPFTGLGLGGFEMAYSSYVVLLHVGHTIHAHNLFLDVWLEQGLLGLVSFFALLVVAAQPLWNALRHGQTLSVWHLAALASLGVIVFHGMTDDPFYGYGGNAIPFLFLPLGVLASPSALGQNGSGFRFVFASGAAVVALVIALLVPSVRAAFVANLGTLAQTQAELSVYHWPEWPIQDELRRSSKIDLTSTVAQYKSALAIDPHNATANRRLGQIELSRGEYDAAQKHLEAAYAVAPDQRATCQMLGELYVIGGKLDEAVALWKNIDVSDGQLEIRQWWYEHIGEPEHTARIKLATQLHGTH